MPEGQFQVTSVVGYFYRKVADLDQWGSRRVLFFLVGQFNKLEICDHKKDMLFRKDVFRVILRKNFREKSGV